MRNKLLQAFAVLILLLASQSSYAGFDFLTLGGKLSSNAPNVGTMFANFNSLWTDFFSLIGIVLPVLATILVGVTAHNAIKYSSRSRDGIKLSTVFGSLAAAIGLFFLPQILSGSASDMSLGVSQDIKINLYQKDDMTSFATSVLGGKNGTEEVFLSIFNLIKLVGLFVVIKAIYSLKSYGIKGGAGDVTIFRFLLHFIPGVCMWYIIEFGQMFFNTAQFGIT